MNIKQITEKKEWEHFLLSQPYTPMVQSWKWGEFHTNMGEDFFVYGVYENERLIGGSLAVTTHALRGSFIFLPYGPIVSDGVSVADVIGILTNKLKEFAKQNGYLFVRMSPFIDESDEQYVSLKNIGYRNSPMHALAENTWILDLSNTEEELLAGMEKGHRYLVKRCIKEGVVVEKKTSKDALDEFNKIHDETSKRHNFFRFPKKYVEKEFEAFNGDKEVLVFLGYLPDGRLDSSAVVYFYGNMAAYRHGASLMKDNKLSTSYLVQWEAIKEAKRRGIRWYNFWGVAPKDASAHHPFKGITHFKKGFGGFQKNLIRCQDYPVSIRYAFTWTVESIRKLKRGFS